MNFTEKRIYSKIKKPKADIHKLISNGYLQRNRPFRKQPRIKPRIGIFGNSISYKATRDNIPPNRLVGPRIQARLNSDLGLLLEQRSEADSFRPVAKIANVSKNKKKANENIDLFSNKFANKPTIELPAFSSNGDTVNHTKPNKSLGITVIDLTTPPSFNNSIAFDRPDFVMDTNNGNIGASYSVEPSQLPESPIYFLNYLENNPENDRHQNFAKIFNEKPSNKDFSFKKPNERIYSVPDANLSMFSLSPDLALDFQTDVETPFSFNSTFFQVPTEATPRGFHFVNVPETIRPSTSYDTSEQKLPSPTPTSPSSATSSSSSPSSPSPYIAPSDFVSAMFRGAEEATDHVFCKPDVLSQKILTNLKEIKKCNSEASSNDTSEFSDFNVFALNNYLDDKNPDLMTPFGDFDKITYNTTKNSCFQINEITNNWQFNITTHNDEHELFDFNFNKPESEFKFDTERDHF